MIKKEIIDQIREQSDIVQIIGEYLPLKKSGKYYKTLCPFHNEKSPSFFVNQERQIYHCFGCGAGGSVVTFLMQYEKMPFLDAIKKLAAKLGIVIETDMTHYKYQALYDANEFAVNFYTSSLEKSKPALEYLKYRKLSSETIKRFHIGYAPSGNLLFNNAKKHGLTDDSLIKAGLVIKKDNGYYDWFYNRITFPVFSISGKVIGFNGRGLDEKTPPKYINTLETPIFKKGENLFGLFQAKNYLYQNFPILVEGNFDLLSLVEHGINNVIAPLGTALTPAQAQLIRRYCNQLIIAFDGDPAGETATLRTIETLLKSGIDPRILILPTQFDPDRYIITYGKEKFNLLVKNSLDFVDFIVKIKNTNTINEKKLCLKQIINYIAIIDENVSQELYINKTAEIFNVNKDILYEQMRKTNKISCTDSKITKVIKPITRALHEEQIASLIIANTQFAAIAKEEVPIECFNSNEIREIIQTIYDNLDLENFSPAKLIDIIEKSELKQIIADLSFRVKQIPKQEEFQRKIIDFKSAWLYNLMQNTKETEDKHLLEKLSLEHYNLKKKLNQMRRKSNES